MTNSELVRKLNLQLIDTRRVFRQAVQRAFRLHNIEMTFEMLQVIHWLWQEDGVTQQHLAETALKDKASLTSMLNNLERKGWAVRREDVVDRRNRRIFLTPAGKALEAVILPLLLDLYGRAGERMDAAQMEESCNCLGKLSDILNEI